MVWTHNPNGHRQVRGEWDSRTENIVRIKTITEVLEEKGNICRKGGTDKPGQ